MAQIIKLFIPPIIWLALKKILSGERKKTITYDGTFSTFDEIYNKYKQVTNYNVSSLNDTFNQAKHGLERYQSRNIPLVNWENIRWNTFSTLVTTAFDAS